MIRWLAAALVAAFLGIGTMGCGGGDKIVAPKTFNTTPQKPGGVVGVPTSPTGGPGVQTAAGVLDD